tara:strand:+ start:5993 stop:6187 length:195 start_codon:yes stop_codon:yes gene_type:complete
MDSWGERITREKYYENKYSGYRGLVMGKSLINIDEETATYEKMKENELSIINFINIQRDRKKNS